MCSSSARVRVSAEATAQRLSTALGDRDIGVNRAPAVELRSRAVRKLIMLYEALRRMMTYLRWYQDDVDDITEGNRSKAHLLKR